MKPWHVPKNDIPGLHFHHGAVWKFRLSQSVLQSMIYVYNKQWMNRAISNFRERGIEFNNFSSMYSRRLAVAGVGGVTSAGMWVDHRSLVLWSYNKIRILQIYWKSVVWWIIENQMSWQYQISNLLGNFAPTWKMSAASVPTGKRKKKTVKYCALDSSVE